VLDLLIRGGQVVTEGRVVAADVGILGEKVAGLYAPGTAPQAAQIYDAAGKYVLPGVIDVHFHCKYLSTVHVTFMDDLTQATASAAHGGVTTIVVFVWGNPGEAPGEYLSAFLKEASELCYTDYAAHCGVRPEMENIRRLPEAFELGVTSFKFHYDYRKTGGGRMTDDDHRLAAMEIIAARGGLAMFHCENGYMIDYLEDKFIAQGKVTPEYFYPSRPNLAEAHSVYTTLVLSELTGCPVYIVHLSAREALELIIQAQARGKPVYAETCPQYLLLTHEKVLEDWGLSKVGPPLRTAADNEAMWWGLQAGFIEIVGSDHAAMTVAAKRAAGQDIFKIPFGMPGTETMLPLLYSEGVVKGRISLPRLVQVLCENPAKRFGLWPRKGALAVGSDADLVILDPEVEWTITAGELHAVSDYTSFEGWKVRGKPVASFLRGRPLLKDGRLQVKPGYGVYLSRRA